MSWVKNGGGRKVQLSDRLLQISHSKISIGKSIKDFHFNSHTACRKLIWNLLIVYICLHTEMHQIQLALLNPARISEV